MTGSLFLRRAGKCMLCLSLIAELVESAPVPPVSLKSVNMAGYSVSLPSSWWVREDKSLDKLMTCNRANGQCTGTGGGFPLAGAIFVVIMPAEIVPGSAHVKTVYDIVDNVPHAGLPAPTIAKVELGDGKTCVVARSLLFGEVWDEVYGLDVRGHLFRISVQYGRESSKEAEYRHMVLTILSSISVRGN
jgi:hypothetical protein